MYGIIDRVKDLKQTSKKDKQSKRISNWGLFSFLGVILLKMVIRPMHLHLSTFGNFLQGTLPNFFAATGFCALAFVYYKLFFNTDNSNTSLSKKLIFASLFTFVGLTLWEIIQYFMGYSIDYEDIFMSALGCLTTYIFIWTIYDFGKSYSTNFKQKY